ncbi:MAG: glycosyltransferase family 1 protein [Sphingobacteriia bacterium]|nr:glycosyltransferase family 1 protein [Sphingobacteriia bacterium]NCC39899.1 glycosyltransferase family 1 protein [Gammaproteobacteria bacterium]
MKIGVSAFATDSGKSGISQYAAHVVGQLLEIAPQHELVAFINRADAAWVRSWHPRLEVIELPDWTAHPILSILWHLLALPLQLRRQGCDLVFMPAANRRLAWSYGVPSVGTVHDFSQLHVPQKYDAARMLYVMRVLPRLMRRLTRVISVSESTRRDLVSFARVPPQRIRVIHNGADLARFAPRPRARARTIIPPELRIPEQYVLYIARLEHPGKNHVRLLEAFAMLKRDTQLPHKLVLVGGRWNGAEVIDERVRTLGLADQVIFPGFVPDALIPALYAGADALVFPSLFEGFGIPLLEAMASGTPVCAANVASIPEVVGDAGLLFDPLDVPGMATSLARLLQDQTLRERLIAAGLARAADFTWERTARGVLEELAAAACQ